MNRQELKAKIIVALTDPDAPWYGSGLVDLVGDYIESVEAMGADLTGEVSSLKEINRTACRVFEADCNGLAKSIDYCIAQEAKLVAALRKIADKSYEGVQQTACIWCGAVNEIADHAVKEASDE